MLYRAFQALKLMATLARGCRYGPMILCANNCEESLKFIHGTQVVQGLDCGRGCKAFLLGAGVGG